MEFSARLTDGLLMIWPRMCWVCLGLMGSSYYFIYYFFLFFCHVFSMKHSVDLRSKGKRFPLDLIYCCESSEMSSKIFLIYAELNSFWVSRSHYLFYKLGEQWHGQGCSQNNFDLPTENLANDWCTYQIEKSRKSKEEEKINSIIKSVKGSL